MQVLVSRTWRNHDTNVGSSARLPRDSGTGGLSQIEGPDLEKATLEPPLPARSHERDPAVCAWEYVGQTVYNNARGTQRSKIDGDDRRVSRPVE